MEGNLASFTGQEHPQNSEHLQGICKIAHVYLAELEL